MVRRAGLRGLIVVLAVGLVALGARASEAGSSNEVLRSLQATMATVKSVRTHFVQEKEMALFKNKLVTRGQILIEMPDHMLWQVESPIRYALLIQGKQVSQWNGETGRTQKIPANPVLTAVLEQMKSWFWGRVDELAKDYEIRQNPEHPSMFVFSPKPGTPPAIMLKSVTVDLQDDRRFIRSILLEETAGDTTRLIFEKTEINVAIESKDWVL